jgi:hypothetical protein
LTDPWRPFLPNDPLEYIREYERLRRELMDPTLWRGIREADEQRRMLDQSRVHLPNTRLLDEITTSLAHVAALQCARETARSQVELVDDRVFASATTRR